MTKALHYNIGPELISEAILSSDGQPLPNLGENFFTRALVP
jgi:hypothetical protein